MQGLGLVSSHSRNTVISRLYFWLSYELQRAETQTKIFCLVRGLFHEDKKTHMKAGAWLSSSLQASTDDLTTVIVFTTIATIQLILIVQII